ncbi:MAG TPA: FAD-dependent monooxygenase [Trebonia sp.]|jgi:2-polyprenyl-6-methoxyphenol hydroxylase-like FAD-dependent oxidoreductase
MGPHDVVVVGGGPVGMWLAAELHRGGIRPVVLERRAERPPHSKALTIYPRTLEQFAMRGIAGRWIAEGMPVPSSHYAILANRLDLSFLGTRFPYTLFLPQRRTEELLAAHLAELGVPVLREHTVTGLRQDAGGVDLDVVTPDGTASLRAAYVVGCDGAGSVVRKAAGIEWAGEPSAWTTILGDTELTDPPRGRALTLTRPGGSIYMVNLGGDRWRIAPVDHATLGDPVGKPVTFSDLRASTLRLVGTDFGMRETPDTWLSRVGDESRHAAAYQAGRVLLAGDAAHVHYPAGGQGLNLGLQDAANLGWKLAAAVRGRIPEEILKTYSTERMPVALDVIADSRAQCALFANPTPAGIALRDRFNDLLGAHESLRRDLALRLSGLGIRYDGQAGAATPAAGWRMPDLDLRGAPAPSIFGLLRPARFVLLVIASPGDTAMAAPAPIRPEMAAGYGDRLDVVTAELVGDYPDWAGFAALLIRPDGHVAWSLPRDTPTPAAPPLAAWLGDPRG